MIFRNRVLDNALFELNLLQLRQLNFSYMAYLVRFGVTHSLCEPGPLSAAKI